jgi:hypothetical protein
LIKPAHVHGVIAVVEHGLNVVELLLMRLHLLSKVPYFVVLLIKLRGLFVVLAFQGLLCLAQHLRLLESTLLLSVELAPQFNHLILLDGSLVLEHLSELLLVALEPLGVLLHLLGAEPQFLDLLNQFLILLLHQLNLLLEALDLPLKGANCLLVIVLPQGQKVARTEREVDMQRAGWLVVLPWGVLKFLQLLLKLGIPGLGRLFLLRQLAHGCLVLGLDAIDLGRNHRELLSQLLSVFNVGLLVIRCDTVLNYDHVVQRLQVLRLTIKSELKGLFLDFMKRFDLLEPTFKLHLDPFGISHMLQLEAFHLVGHLLNLIVALKRQHRLGLFSVCCPLRRPLLMVFTLQLPLEELLTPFKGQALHLQLEILDEAVLVLELATEVTLTLPGLLLEPPSLLFELDNLLLVGSAL